MFKMLAVALAALATSAHGATIYTDPSTTPNAGWNSSSKDFAVTYDDFVLAGTPGQTYTVNGATWSGAYFDNTGNAIFGSAGAQTFQMYVFNSDGSAPVETGGINGAIDTVNFTVTPTGTAYVLSYATNFSGFTLNAGQQYWLSFYATAPIKGDNWAWVGSYPGGNSVQYYQQMLNNRATNQTFSLSGFLNPAVPEPATWTTMLAGFGMLGFAMRRRRTSVSFG